MTEKRFVYDDFDDVIKDTYTQKEYNYHIGELELIVEEINNLHEEKEYWKGNACNNINFVNILLHELDIAQEKGYEVSDPFKKLMKEELIE